MSHTARIQSLQKTILDSTVLLISDPLDIYYLTSFLTLTPEREAFLFLTQKSAIFFLSFFSAAPKISGVQIFTGSIERLIKEQLPLILANEEIQRFSFDSSTLTVKEYEHLKTTFPALTYNALPESPTINIRMVKDADELKSIAHANHITHTAIAQTIKKLKKGLSEKDVQHMVEQAMREQGVEEFAFPTIVAFGEHSALPHHQPMSDRLLEENEAILIDCGAKWQHYCADVTRTIWFGKDPDEEFLKIEKIVKDAYSATLQRCNVATSQSNQPTASSLDKTARDLITAAGYGNQFIHTTGHGVGLYIHEQPSLNQRNETLLKPGMVITIEPGIYLEGQFGYRFENSVAITGKGTQELL